MPTPKHIVAVAGLVSDDHQRVLMVLSPRGDWEFPGGQVEEGESLTAALEREVLEETGVRVAAGHLVGVYSNVKSLIVMLDFLCSYVSGEPTCSSESLQVEWVARDEALSRVIRPVIQDRLRDMLEFDGRVVYRSYSFHADQVHTEYIVHEDRHI
ncbi:MAG: NUDIX domain-containing protein [Capsulimonas sp.]|uniref:NUDIX hydrolase n=1 Tax=Capsulimonas sp. TaxID=2494211 RepID=UPI00326594DE